MDVLEKERQQAEDKESTVAPSAPTTPNEPNTTGCSVEGTTQVTTNPPLALNTTDPCANATSTPAAETTTPAFTQGTAVPVAFGTMPTPFVGTTVAPTVETAPHSEGGTVTTSPAPGVGAGQETTESALAPNATGTPLENETISNFTTFAPSLNDSIGNIFDRPTQEITNPPLDANATDPFLNVTTPTPNATYPPLGDETNNISTFAPSFDNPFLNFTTQAPNATYPPLGDETNNTSTFAPSLDNSAGNVFGQPKQGKEKEEEEAPFIQNASVVLEGLTQLLDDTEQETYVQATQAFLRKEDPSAVVEFVGQKLIKVSLSRRLDGIRRLVEQQKLSSALEVTTSIKSWEDESSGTTATNLIQSDSRGYVEILQQTSNSFDQLQNVEAAAPPVAIPIDGLSTPPKSNGEEQNSIIWYVGGLLILALICAIFFSFKYVKLAKQSSATWDDEESCEKRLGGDTMRNNTSKEDDALYSKHSRYQYDQDEDRVLEGFEPSEQNDSWVCEQNVSQQRQKRVSANSFGDSSDSSRLAQNVECSYEEEAP